MSFALGLIVGLAVVLGAVALARGSGRFRQGLVRGLGQTVELLPRMLCALVGAGFLVRLIPTDTIGALLGPGSGLIGIVAGALVGMLIPAGPVVSFSIAAAFAAEGASVPALVAFITAWSVVAPHRIAVYEIPLLGKSFLRLRFLSALLLPFVAGALALLARQVSLALAG